MYSTLGSRFEEKLLKVASNFVAQESGEIADYSRIMPDTLEFNLPDDSPTFSDYHTSENYSIITSISSDELERWKSAYESDPTTSKILKDDEDEESSETFSQYQVRENGLIYFEDWNGNHRVVVPSMLRVEIMSEIHNTITEAAHGGYAKTYNRIAAIYYWPRMSRDIKKYVGDEHATALYAYFVDFDDFQYSRDLRQHYTTQTML